MKIALLLTGQLRTIEMNKQLTQDLRDMGTSASQIPVYIQKI